MKSDLRTIAANTGYSIATVSRALNGEKYVSEAVRKKIFAEAARLGRRTERNTVLVITSIQLLGTGYLAKVLKKLWEQLVYDGFRCELVTSDSIDVIEEQLIAGAISLMSTDGLEQYWGKNFSVPLVCINTSSSHLHNVWSVLTEEYGAMKMLLEHLYNIDHRKIMLLAAPEQSSYQYCAATRREAFASITSQMKLEAAPVTTIIWNEPGIMAQKIIKSGVTAVIVSSESFIEPLITSLRYHGIRVPEDISVCGWIYKDGRAAETTVTGVEQDFDGLVKNAVSNLKKLIAKEKVTQDIFVPCFWHDRLTTALAKQTDGEIEEGKKTF